VKDNQPTLHQEAQSYFETAPATELDHAETLGKDHGRLETRRHTVSKSVDWFGSDRAYPGARRFNKLAVIAKIEATVEKGSTISNECRYYISSRALAAEAFGHAVRSHWAIENNLHWTLDVTFHEDLSRLRAGHGARNMAVVRHFALNLVRQAKDKRAIKRKTQNGVLELSLPARNPTTSRTLTRTRCPGRAVPAVSAKCGEVRA